MEANFKENNIPVKTGQGITVVKVQRGQFIFGRKRHAKELNIPESTLWKIILKLEKLGNLNTKRNTKFTLVTVCNYDLYQNIENYQGTPKGTTKEQPRNNQGTQQKEGKKERKKELNNKHIKKEIGKPENVTGQTWNDFLIHRKGFKAPITQTVINSFLKQAEKAGYTLEQAIIESISRGWRGFKAEWIKNNKQKPPSTEEKLSLEKFKEAIQYKIDNQKPGQPFKFKNSELNKIIEKHPMINDYAFDSIKFDLAYKEYKKL